MRSRDGRDDLLVKLVMAGIDDGGVLRPTQTRLRLAGYIMCQHNSRAKKFRK
ncbi:MAG: hypothetical protein Q8O64_13675 [Sideroxyarcus sp.]|nr:hypothetical protein [Sideroxyarcus sp.]